MKAPSRVFVLRKLGSVFSESCCAVSGNSASVSAFAARMATIERLHYQTGFFIGDDNFLGLFFTDVFAHAVFNIVSGMRSEGKAIPQGLITSFAYQFFCGSAYTG